MIFVLIGLSTSTLYCQYIDVSRDRIITKGPGGLPKSNEPKFEYLNLANFGFSLSDATVNSTMQFLKLRIGEDTGFSVPLRIFLSSPNIGISKAKLDQISINSLLSPVGGLFNFLIDDSKLIWDNGSKTGISLSYGVGYKFINGTLRIDSSFRALHSLYANLGCRFSTGAFVEDGQANKGDFILQTKAFGTSSIGKESLTYFFPEIENKFIFGLSVDAVLFIDKTIDLRLSYLYSPSKLFDANTNNSFLSLAIDTEF